MEKSGRITLADVKKHIKRCKKRGVRFDWIGFTENKDLVAEVEALFSFNNLYMSGYDWVHGNNRLKQLINEMEA